MLSGRQGRRPGTGELNPAVIGFFTVDRLRKELENRGLISTGNKSALEERLLEAVKCGKTVLSPDASASTATVSIKTEFIETEETPPAKKRGRKRKAEDVPLEPETSEPPTPSALPTTHELPAEECKKAVKKSLKKFTWATRPPVEALQKAFEPPLIEEESPSAPPLQMPLIKEESPLVPPPQPILINEKSPSVPPAQLPLPTQLPPITSITRDSASPEVKILSVVGKAPSIIRSPALSPVRPPKSPQSAKQPQDDTLASKPKPKQAKYEEKTRPPKPSQSAKRPTDLLGTISAKQDETLASKSKPEQAKFPEKTRPPKPPQSAKQPIDPLETIIAKHQDHLASKHKSKHAKFEEKTRFELERRRASGVEHLGSGRMEPPRRIQENRSISRDTASPEVKTPSLIGKTPSIIRTPALPTVRPPKPHQSAKQPIDLLETIIAKQDETLASKYKSEQAKIEEKTRFELERRRASGVEHLGFGRMEPPRRIQENKSTSIDMVKTASNFSEPESDSAGYQEKQKPPAAYHDKTIKIPRLPPPKPAETSDGENENRKFPGSPSPPPKLTETSEEVENINLPGSPPPKPAETYNGEEEDEKRKLPVSPSPPPKLTETSYGEEDEDRTLPGSSPPKPTETSDGEEIENINLPGSPPPKTTGTSDGEEEDGDRTLPGSPPPEATETSDGEEEDDENVKLPGSPQPPPKPIETSHDAQKHSNQPEQLLLKDPKGLLSRASEVLKKMNKSDVDNQEQLNQYEQVLDAEPEASSPEEQEKPLPDFHGEPVPDDEDDDALFEIAAGLRPPKKREMGPPVIEEEPLPDDDFIELDYYNADLNIKAANSNKWLIDPDNGDGFALMWGGVRSNYGIVLADDFLPAEKVAFQIKIVEFLSLKHVPFEEMEPHDVRIGWSAAGTSNMLGESAHSYSFCSLGKKAHANHFEEYGEAFHAGDVVTTVLDLSNCEIRFYKNKVNLGTAFIDMDFKSGDVVFPHIATKNCKVLVNFGGDEEELPETEDLTLWSLPPEEADSTMVAKLRNGAKDGIVASRRPPPDKTSCTVIAMVGLPGAGKTTWVRQYLRDHPEEHWILLNTDTILSAMTINGVPRRRAHQGRWDMVMGLTAKALNRSLQMACRRRHNYIIDKTNVSKEVRKKLAQFQDFQRKCVVIIPSDEELERRLIKQSRLDGGAGQIPAEAMLELKAMFSIPCTETEPVDDVKFIEPPISRINEAIELVKKYNEEGKPWMRQPYGRTKKPESVISDHRDMPNQWVAGRPSI
ncbi:AAA domain-containing protein [Ditylenchus destructor]|uniref:AAA domain-containing protein n=1 Tax=Ditylenchus destructor TaxID=166010 RepID=A0AAD4QYC6_9BILA|nr:AAA domain-containing protein [Ditylenchus destructor]